MAENLNKADTELKVAGNKLVVPGLFRNFRKELRILLIVIIQLALSIGSFVYAHVDMQRNTNDQEDKDKGYDRSRLFTFEIDSTPEQTKAKAFRQYETCPPLKPERFRRRVKILWGIDLNDYPEDAIIWYGEAEFKEGDRFYSKYQIIEKDSIYEGGPWQINGPSDKLFNAARKYMLYDDSEAYKILKKDHEEYKDHDLGNFRDLLLTMYTSVLSAKPQLIQYMDEIATSVDLLSDSYKLDLLVNNVGVGTRISDTKNNLHTLYVLDQLRKGRTLVNPVNGLFNAIPMYTSDIVYPYNTGDYMPERPIALPWQQKDLCERNLAANLSFLLQWRSKEMNKRVMQFMTNQLDDYDLTFEYPERIRSNNYYGYAILREFCENPEQEMATLRKFATSFNARVVNSNTLLYLEPYPDSYDIDTIQPSEVFKVYEMGYDDYYFVEAVKPVESPVAGSDGYAMILDRTETVYGYIRKTEVKEISEIEVVSQKIKSRTGEPKRGIIDDADGYVNIRKESNAESDIISKIVEKELFFYWEIPNSNWWYVQTKDNLNGFIHKSRIREKVDAGNWILDE